MTELRELLQPLLDAIGGTGLRSISKALAILLTGGFVNWLLGRSLKLTSLHPQYRLLLRRALTYVIVGFTIAWALAELGVHAGVLLGAASVLTVAVGFASQTSASNLISGLFLIAEQPFVVGDVIEVDGVSGEVVSIDLLSVRLRTFANLLVRIPNETLLKAKMTNRSHFPLRRFDLKLSVAYKEDLDRVKEVLLKLAVDDPLCLVEPQPLFLFLGFGDSGVELQFSVWGATQNYLQLMNGISLGAKTALDEAGIEIPFPHLSLYAGSATEPLPIRLADGTQPPPVADELGGGPPAEGSVG